jgi:N utilization substance protein B
MTPRRRAREVALQVLYSLDANPEQDPAAVLALYFDRFARPEDPDDSVDGEAFDRPFAEQLVGQVWSRRAELDEQIAQVSRSWRVERMARVDRTILRMAVYELRHCDDVPSRVTLNEAIELAKRYGAEEAPAFVNGLLDSALRTLGVRK